MEVVLEHSECSCEVGLQGRSVVSSTATSFLFFAQSLEESCHLAPLDGFDPLLGDPLILEDLIKEVPDMDTILLLCSIFYIRNLIKAWYSVSSVSL